LSLSGGANRLITQQVENLGGNIAVVRPGTGQTALADIAASSGVPAAASTLTEADATDLGSIEGVDSVAPLMIISGKISSQDQVVSSGVVVATNPSLIDISDIEIRDGQFMDSVTNKHAAVIGPQLAIDLFGTDQAIGNTFK